MLQKKTHKELKELCIVGPDNIIDPALEKLRGYDMKSIDSVPNVGQAVISKKKKYTISKLNRR